MSEIKIAQSGLLQHKLNKQADLNCQKLYDLERHKLFGLKRHGLSCNENYCSSKKHLVSQITLTLTISKSIDFQKTIHRCYQINRHES